MTSSGLFSSDRQIFFFLAFTHFFRFPLLFLLSSFLHISFSLSCLSISVHSAPSWLPCVFSEASLNHRRTPALRFATLQAILSSSRVTECNLGSFSALIVQIVLDLSISSLFSGPWRTPHCLGCVVVVWIATGRHGYSLAFLLLPTDLYLNSFSFSPWMPFYNTRFSGFFFFFFGLRVSVLFFCAKSYLRLSVKSSSALLFFDFT